MLCLYGMLLRQCAPEHAVPLRLSGAMDMEDRAMEMYGDLRLLLEFDGEAEVGRGGLAGGEGGFEDP